MGDLGITTEQNNARCLYIIWNRIINSKCQQNLKVEIYKMLFLTFFHFLIFFSQMDPSICPDLEVVLTELFFYTMK